MASDAHKAIAQLLASQEDQILRDPRRWLVDIPGVAAAERVGIAQLDDLIVHLKVCWLCTPDISRCS